MAIGDRRHWPTYKESDIPHTDWLKEAQSSFQSSLLNLVEEVKHPRLSRTSMGNKAYQNDRSPQFSRASESVDLEHETDSTLYLNANGKVI